MKIIGTQKELEKVLASTKYGFQETRIGICLNCEHGKDDECTKECAERHGVEFIQIVEGD